MQNQHLNEIAMAVDKADKSQTNSLFNKYAHLIDKITDKNVIFVVIIIYIVTGIIAILLFQTFSKKKNYS